MMKIFSHLLLPTICLFLTVAQSAKSAETDDPFAVSTSEAINIEEVKIAAEDGNVHGQFNLGRIYERGLGVTKDYVEARKWYLKAADQGDADAQISLGFIYYLGEGVPEDDAEAAKWFRKAAEQGDAESQYSLGLVYAKGEGVAKDYVESYKWLLLSNAQGHEPAKKAVVVFESNITREQIAEGQKLAREFQRREN